MAPLKVTIEFATVSGILADSVMNDWVFVTTGAPTTTDTDAIAADLNAFYNSINAPATASVASFMGGQLSRTIAPTLRYYDLTGHLNGSPVGSPFLTRPLATTLGIAGSSQDLPAEVCVCLTYKCEYGTDSEFGPIDPATGKKSRPRARDRGRIYISPLTVNAIENTPSHAGDARPVAGFITALTASAEALVAAGTPSWSQWSKRRATTEPVVGGWVDNAMDTQRRRGATATARTAFGSLG